MCSYPRAQSVTGRHPLCQGPGEVLDGLTRRVPEARVGLAGLRHWHWEGWRAETYQRGVSLSFPSEAASARIASGTASSYPGTTPNARQPP